MNPTKDQRRYHALDGLRAGMMLLGIVFHAALPYTTLPRWPFKDSSTHPVFDVLTVFLHIFRVPIFFAMAGFFAALLWERYGTRAFIGNRLRRIAVPLVVGWIFLCPLTLMGLRFARQVTLSGSMWDGLQALGARHLFTWRFFHLWFLADLLLFYVLALTVRWLIGQLALEQRERLSETCRTLLRSSWHSAIFAVPTAALLLPIHLDRADLTTGLLLQVLLFMLFGFGVVLYAQRDFLGTWSRNAWRQVILAVALLPFAFWGARRTLLSEPQWDVTARLVGASTAALMLWLLLSGLMGLFIRYLDRPNQIYRYLSDASYSLYLLHLPMVVWVGGLVAGTALPAGIKYLLTLVVSIPALLLIYHYAIRSSGLAAVLGVSNKNPEAVLRLADRTYDSA